MSEQKKRHRWTHTQTFGPSGPGMNSHCGACGMARLRGSDGVDVYRAATGGPWIVAPAKVPPCQPPSNKKTNTGAAP